MARADTPGAKRAVLHYRMLDHGNNRSLVEIDLVTGRPHQIRVQFASRGMPLVGDARYGSGGRQLALYATGISLIHPTKQAVSYTHLDVYKRQGHGKALAEEHIRNRIAVATWVQAQPAACKSGIVPV